MAIKSKVKKTTNLTVRQLINQLHQSGYSMELKSESALLSQSNKQHARARQIAAQIKGLIVPDSNSIFINRSLPVEERVVTALHELIHLHSPQLSETETEREALRLYRESNDHDLGYLEFLVS